jgi:hypothetical protein
MSLTMRPTGLGAGIDKDRPDYTVYCGGWAVGRIYETRGAMTRWFWSLTVDPPDGALGQGGDAGGGEGAVSEELGRLEGVGGAAGNAVGRRCSLIRVLGLVGEADPNRHKLTGATTCHKITAPARRCRTAGRDIEQSQGSVGRVLAVP